MVPCAVLVNSPTAEFCTHRRPFIREMGTSNSNMEFSSFSIPSVLPEISPRCLTDVGSLYTIGACPEKPSPHVQFPHVVLDENTIDCA